MENHLLQWLPAHPGLVFLISIILNIIIAISGVIPSAFLTAANITFFGFSTGLIVSIIGEAAGAVVSFILYRKGLHKLAPYVQTENKLLKKLKNTRGVEAVFLVLSLRILPFVPSGAVTLTAAFSKMNLLSFTIASTLGKIPSLFIEAYSVNHVLKLTIEWQVGILLSILFLFACYQVWKRRHK
ncbi:hypothetical protein F9802_07360 [Bacillus aerolatus]|uniref:TVP38/TMEM64 family membrane protein n=1 Tax=Bacillus aerolatus TaxID=2653354 RepID=A0A6I1FH71_9BACI|nr:VTT domain-containing protein [Bacillus aerolatus]KAB7707555.1 hypothetical protein F9802_07360 [Bacillus aerolatus]